MMFYRRNQPRKPPPGPAWARRLCGDDFFVNVVGVTWRGEPPSDADFRVLAGLRHVKRLSLAHTSIDDASLSRLAILDQVRELELRATAITDAGLARFPRLPKLERVYLARTNAPTVALLRFVVGSAR